jgi:hypothetical protein
MVAAGRAKGYAFIYLFAAVGTVHVFRLYIFIVNIINSAICINKYTKDNKTAKYLVCASRYSV